MRASPACRRKRVYIRWWQRCLIYALLGHIAPSGGAGHFGDGRAAGFIGGCCAGGDGRCQRLRSAAYQAYASAFVLVTGFVFLVAGLARLGFITQFLSKPVMDGFVMGLAIFVAVGQLNKLFGVPKPEGNTVEKLIGIIKELPEANWVTFAVGAGRWRCSSCCPAGARNFRPAWWCCLGPLR